MASPAQCYYCFESLSASFEGTEVPSLSVIDLLWEEHERAKNHALKPFSTNAAGESDTGEGEDEWEGFSDTADEDGDEELQNLGNGRQEATSRPAPLKLPSISRLQGVPSTGSSNSSTPSALSATSSRSALTAATSMTSQSTISSSSFAQPKSYSAMCRSNADVQYPLFVTWNLLSRDGRKQLRGCIGTFEPQSLPSGLKSYALSS